MLNAAFSVEHEHAQTEKAILRIKNDVNSDDFGLSWVKESPVIQKKNGQKSATYIVARVNSGAYQVPTIGGIPFFFRYVPAVDHEPSHGRSAADSKNFLSS